MQKILIFIFLFLLSTNLNASEDNGKTPIEERDKDTLMSLSQDPAKLGYQIAIELDNRDLGFKDVRSKMQMTLKNDYGQENKREMRIDILEVPKRSKGDKSMIIFDSPRDVKGTALLSFAKILEADDQWLYLPSLKRVKRISSKNKSGPFVGSEFAYEDITANEIDKYEWKFLSVEKCQIMDQECFKLETTPKYEHSGYTKRIVWIDAEEFRVDKIDFYDRKNELLKTQTYHDYKEYLDKFWRADLWKMQNHQTGKSTDIAFEYYNFKTGLTDADFNQARLKRIK